MQIPDFHPSVVHFPIALLSLGSVAGLLHLYWRPMQELRTLTWIPLLIGWLGAVLAVVTGLFAQSGLPPDAPYQATLNIHVYTGFGVTILYAVVLYRRWLFGKRRGKETGMDLLEAREERVLLTVVFALGLALVLVTGAYGGQLVFQWGVNVQPPH
jgi:uncharacterized membrane protein